MIKYQTASEAVSLVKSNTRVFVQGAAATPLKLIEALIERHQELTSVEICHLHTEGPAEYANPIYSKSFSVNSFFVSANIRPWINHVHVQYVPIFLSEVPMLFRKNIMPIDTAFIHVSVPDEHGFCSLGVSVDVTKAATDVAKQIIALVNPNMPRTLGDGLIHISKITAAVYCNDPIIEVPSFELNQKELAIGNHIANIIENGATLQLGIGAIPNAVLQCLGNHKDLGIHTEMFSDGILPLVEKGVITGKFKKKHPNKIVSSFVMGTRKLYDFINDNPEVSILDAEYVNNSNVIRQNPKVSAINSALEIDLTGQICSDSMGTSIYSGVGGQMDFIRGAALSEGGKPIIAIASITNNGISKIVPLLKKGAGVVTSRAHVHYVITEYGVAYLYGKNIAQRSKALIEIAHPNHREWLARESFELYGS